MQLDLNLLTALDALLEEGSVAGAAARLQVTSPAMSRTLGRIRRATGDEILVRTGREMTPTPRAVALRGEVHRLVEEARALLAPEQEVDLATLDRTFTLRWHDVLTTACAPALHAAVRSRAPGVRLRFLAETSADGQDQRRGEVDLETASDQPVAPGTRYQQVGTDQLVVALRDGHPLAERPLTVDQYAAAEHVTVSRRGRLHDPVDEALALLGQHRRVVAAVPTASAAIQLACRSDLLVTVPALVSRALLGGSGLRALPLPVAMPAVPLYLTWHQRYDSDRAHAWLRGQADLVLRAAAQPDPDGAR